ncbi:MAG: serine/threonine-protein kinase [Xenococcaceae cyanobacterium MO_207.B15]|nr:serine/threonine-protein kinase [Xenococcaceae cyanobacterium MO_207.B15]
MIIGRTLLSRYKIAERLGGGGFGDTYKAIDLALPDHPPCMVKHLFPKNSNPDILPIAKELFEREAKTLYLLGEHNQIPRLFAHFEENGEFYLVQEYVDGHDLSEEITGGKKLSEEQTSKLLQDILEVLAFVHEQNVIHRDIKPSNIMRRKQDGKLVLIDFGSVKVLSALTVNPQGLTDVTIGVGSPGYMPSEQSRGKPKLASDVYAVGIIGIQALTGLTPQNFPEDPNTGEIIWRNLVSVSDELATVLDTMTRDHFSKRYQNASQALEALIPTKIIPELETSEKKKKWIVPMFIGIIIVFSGISWGTYKLLNQSNITYDNLEKSLKQKKWQEADMTTAQLMLKFGDKDNNNWLDSNEINYFDCLEINKIDLLWQHYSNGKFGFGSQKRIYLETGNNIENYDEEAYNKFGEKIGWIQDNRWIDYEAIFDFDNLENAQFGLLPLGRRLKNKQLLTVWLSNNGELRSQWFLTTKTCQIWLKYSEQKFCFSVQKRIWNNIKNIDNRNEEFGKLVGWFSQGRWLRSYDLNYQLEEAPERYFPSVSRPGSLSSGWTGRVLLTPSLSKQSHCLNTKFNEN